MSFFTLLTAGLAAFAPLVSAYTQPQGNGPAGNPFSAPGSGTTVQAGKDFTVQWNPDTDGTVTLLLLKGQNGQSLSVLYPIAEKIQNTGSYTWHVASDLTAGPSSTTGYGIQLIVDSNGQYQYTTPFGVAAAAGSSSSSSDSAPTPRLGAPVANTRAASTSAAATSDASIQTYAADSSSASSDAVVASVYTDATSTGIVLVTPTAAPATTTLATSASVVKATTTSRAPSGTTVAAGATSTGSASSVKTSFMGLAAAAGLAILAL